MHRFLLILLGFSFLLSCTDKETIYEDAHIIEVVEGNIPPPSTGVTTVQLNNYINKSYIDLLGREPNSTELSTATNILRQGNVGYPAMEQFLNGLVNSGEYYNRFNDIYFGSMLNSLDSIEIYYFRITLETQLQAETDPLVVQEIQKRIDQLDDLQNAKEDYQQGAITVNEYMIRLADNFFYDEINMGVENFVLACFENFFKRLPTEDELEEAKTMVRGFPAQLLFEDGATRAKFLEIMTTNAEFYQGLVIDNFLQLLARNPSSVEMGENTTLLNDGTLNYQSLQKEIIKSQEYRGF